MNTGNLPARSDLGRRSPLWDKSGPAMEQEDWSRLASAYDTYHETGIEDPDVYEYCRGEFSLYGLWNPQEDAPMLNVYRGLIRARC